MANFGNYAKLKPLNNAQRFDFEGLAPEGQPEPFVMLLPIDELNPAFLTMALERAADPKAPKFDATKMSAETIITQNQVDLEVVAMTCIADWGNVCDEDGNDVDLTPETALEFLNAIPTLEFKRLRAFGRNLKNYTPAAARKAGDELGKAVPLA
jgi:hypothetical protein